MRPKAVEEAWEAVLGKLERLRKKGVLYRALLHGTGFPLRIALKRYLLALGAADDPPAAYERVAAWSAFWSAGMAQRSHGALWETERSSARIAGLGLQKGLVTAIAIPEARCALALLGRAAEADGFIAMHERVCRVFPEAEEWLVQSFETLWGRGSDTLERLISLGRAFRRGIGEGAYLREICAEGVDTKFIEQNIMLVRSLWNALMPERQARNRDELLSCWQAETAETDFIGVRLLGADMSLFGIRQFHAAPRELAALSLPHPIRRVFIVENQVTALRFPAVPSSVLLYGMGYGVLKAARFLPWLAEADVLYWGDLDTNGLDILSKLRQVLPRVRSFLMDEATLLRYADAKVQDTGGCETDTSALTVGEKRCWRLLKEGGMRLEQERVPPAALHAWLAHENLTG